MPHRSYLARFGAIDVSPTLIEQAQEAARQQSVPNVQFEVGDVLAIPFEANRFDLVFSHALLEHLPEPLDGLAEMTRVLKSGGVLALRTPG